jgi:imidazolonepropionase-like amidohydrolase
MCKTRDAARSAETVWIPCGGAAFLAEADGMADSIVQYVETRRARREHSVGTALTAPFAEDDAGKLKLPAGPPRQIHMRNHRAIVVALPLVALLAGSGHSFGQAGAARGGTWALVGGTAYVDPVAAPIVNSVVLIEADRIVAIGPRSSVRMPPGTDVVDCSGMTITAGFWNSHVHFIERKWSDASKTPAGELAEQLRDMLTRYGVTSVFDTGSRWENTRHLRERIESGEIPGPRIQSTGEIVFPRGGAPAELVLDILGAMKIQFPQVVTPAEARTAAAALLDAGVDGIKVYAASLGSPAAALPQDAIEAAAREAHLRRTPVFAHPQNRDGLMAAVQGGADVLVHTAPSAGPWDETILSSMKRAGVALIPTLKLWNHELRHERVSARAGFVNVGVGQLQAWHESGGEVLFGTDVGYMDDYDPTDEYALMAAAGLNFRQILASMTTAPAARFGRSKGMGRIAAGQVADLVVLHQDPAREPRAFAAVRYTIRGGERIYDSQAKARAR